MRRITYLAVGFAAALTQPAFAQRQSRMPSDDELSSREAPDLERQIRELDDSIDAEDREGRISPREADDYIRQLRAIETQLLDVRARTFGDPVAGDGWRTAPAPTYRGRDTDGGEDDRRDSREPEPAPDSRDRDEQSGDYL